MTETTDVKIDKSLIERGRQARFFIDEVGMEPEEQPISDELIMRAVVVYGMLERRGALRSGPLGDEMSEACAIALIAYGFSDTVPSTPQRAKLFAATLDEAYDEGEQ